MCIKQMADLFTLDKTLAVRVKFLSDNNETTYGATYVFYSINQDK